MINAKDAVHELRMDELSIAKDGQWCLFKSTHSQFYHSVSFILSKASRIILICGGLQSHVQTHVWLPS